MLDSYDRFIRHFGISKEDLFDFGLTETIYPAPEQVERSWTDLKRRIMTGKPVYIRGYGRDAHGTQLYTDFYAMLLGNPNVKKDPTNNLRPQNIISELTGFKRNVTLFNYQVSHIFGRTKNVFLFEAPWNIVFVPKLIDPFTGHETKGPWPVEYQRLFLQDAKRRYREYIEDYNDIIRRLAIPEQIRTYTQSLSGTLSRKALEQFQADALAELSCIDLQ